MTIPVGCSRENIEAGRRLYRQLNPKKFMNDNVLKAIADAAKQLQSLAEEALTSTPQKRLGNKIKITMLVRQLSEMVGD